MDTTVRSVHLYPIKACRGIDVDGLTIGPTGPVGDRRWQVIDAEGQPVTQRTAPVLATVAVALQDEGVPDGGLRLSADGHGSVEVAAPGAEGRAVDPIEVSFLVGGTTTAGDGGDEVATWLSDLLGHEARLAAMIDATDIRLPARIDMWGHAISFADAAPILVANQASCDWLVERASEPFGMDRFRANIVVEGAEPWVEDTWQRFTIGPAELTGRLPWPRCAVPQVDQGSGQRHKEPALVLKAHRWCESGPADLPDSLPEAVGPMLAGNALFGWACDAGPVGARVSVGDRVEVQATSEPLVAPPD